MGALGGEGSGLHPEAGCVMGRAEGEGQVGMRLESWGQGKGGLGLSSNVGSAGVVTGHKTDMSCALPLVWLTAYLTLPQNGK